MDPVTAAVVAAIAAGAAAAAESVTSEAVNDAYRALKGLVVSKLGDRADVDGAIRGIEKRPQSESRRSVLAEELSAAHVNEDVEIVRECERFSRLLEDAKATSTSIEGLQESGSGAMSQGAGAAVGSRGIAVGGNLSGTAVTGDNNVVSRDGGEESSSD